MSGIFWLGILLFAGIMLFSKGRERGREDSTSLMKQWDCFPEDHQFRKDITDLVNKYRN